MTDSALEALALAATKGVVCVRGSRVPTGFAGRNVEIDYNTIGLVAAYEHNPQKARVLLRLALLKTQDPEAIQSYFARY